MGMLNVADKAANDHYQVSNKTRVQKYLQRVFSPAAGQGQNRQSKDCSWIPKQILINDKKYLKEAFSLENSSSGFA